MDIGYCLKSQYRLRHLRCTLLSYRHPIARCVGGRRVTRFKSLQWTQYHKACALRTRDGPILDFKAFTNLCENKKKEKKKDEKKEKEEEKKEASSSPTPTKSTTIGLLGYFYYLVIIIIIIKTKRSIISIIIIIIIKTIIMHQNLNNSTLLAK